MDAVIHKTTREIVLYLQPVRMEIQSPVKLFFIAYFISSYTPLSALEERSHGLQTKVSDLS